MAELQKVSVNEFNRTGPESILEGHPSAPGWQDAAREDRDVKAWYKQLLKRGKVRDFEEAPDMIDFMLGDKFYDYRSAMICGVRPQPNEDGIYTWPDKDPISGQLLRDGAEEPYPMGQGRGLDGSSYIAINGPPSP
jgi:hypothetical protein